MIDSSWRTGTALIGLAAILLAGGCGGSAENGGVVPGVTADELVIGTSAAFTGHASFLGTQFLKGHQAYFEDVNTAGGIHGRKIRVIALDDGYDPPRTVANTKQLIEQNQVFMLFGYTGTPTSVRIIEPVHAAGIPTFGFFTGAEALRTPFRPMMFHVRDSYYAEVEAAVAYFVDHLGFKRISVVYQDDPFGSAILRGVQLALQKRNVGLVTAAPIQRGSLEVESAVEPVMGLDAQVVIMAGTYGPLARLVRTCNDRGFYPYFHTVSFVGSEAFARELVEVSKVDPTYFGRVTVTQVVPSPRSEGFPAVKEFRDSFSRHYPDDSVNYVALEGYLNARVLVHGLERAGPDLTRPRFIEALEGIAGLDVGLEEPISYGIHDRLGLEKIFLSRVSGEGVFQTFEP